MIDQVVDTFVVLAKCLVLTFVASIKALLPMGVLPRKSVKAHHSSPSKSKELKYNYFALFSVDEWVVVRTKLEITGSFAGREVEVLNPF
ncbi:unnamed protein product [Cylicostephanus goldi]|uniref:Uncharacterized protein n=1 Tax=Cylicostephanus goldi TaxID=71465 RepID=A0A3P7PXC2_CYLGO|nr:unnamed protein product [Cylicostephanus goldi]